MTITSLDHHIEITPDIAGGRPRVAGRRIKVQDIVIWHDRLGKSADEIASEYDLTLSDVYAALTYYFDHRLEIDRYIEEDRQFVLDLQQKIPSKLRQKLAEQNLHGTGD